MTEKEWLTCDNAILLVDHVLRSTSIKRNQKGRRKLRLYNAVCCRHLIDLLGDERSRKAVECCEEVAEGRANARDLEVAEAMAAEASMVLWAAMSPAPLDMGIRLSWYAAVIVNHAVREGPIAQSVGLVVSQANSGPGARDWQRAFSRLAFEVFGNPFRPATVNLAWITRDVLHLAHAAYDERILPRGELDGARLRVLSDALEEADCGDASIFDHLRSPGPHFRGCHVLDLILGKS